MIWWIYVCFLFRLSSKVLLCVVSMVLVSVLMIIVLFLISGFYFWLADYYEPIIDQLLHLLPFELSCFGFWSTWTQAWTWCSFLFILFVLLVLGLEVGFSAIFVRSISTSSSPWILLFIIISFLCFNTIGISIFRMALWLGLSLLFWLFGDDCWGVRKLLRLLWLWSRCRRLCEILNLRLWSWLS